MNNPPRPTVVRRIVLRWQVPVDGSVHEIGGGRVLHVSARHPGIVEIWTEENMASYPEPDATVIRTPRRVTVCGAGQALPVDAGDHLGTTFDGGSTHLVWHLYEVRR